MEVPALLAKSKFFSHVRQFWLGHKDSNLSEHQLFTEAANSFTKLDVHKRAAFKERARVPKQSQTQKAKKAAAAKHNRLKTVCNKSKPMFKRTIKNRTMPKTMPRTMAKTMAKKQKKTLSKTKTTTKAKPKAKPKPKPKSKAKSIVKRR